MSWNFLFNIPLVVNRPFSMNRNTVRISSSSYANEPLRSSSNSPIWISLMVARGSGLVPTRMTSPPALATATDSPTAAGLPAHS